MFTICCVRRGKRGSGAVLDTGVTQEWGVCGGCGGCVCLWVAGV